MTSFRLIIGNKNYSSWSLRPWLLMRQAGIPFEEELLPLDTPEFHERIGALSPGRTVPTLQHGDLTVWDSLAIAEYLAEQFPDKALWPADATARARARAIVAEMHAGFSQLRGALPMNIRARAKDFAVPEAAARDIARVIEIWQSCRREAAAGPFLFGEFTVADAFYAPVVTRFRTYGVAVPPEAAAYMEAILALPAMQEWEAAAIAEANTLPHTDRYASGI